MRGVKSDNEQDSFVAQPPHGEHEDMQAVCVKALDVIEGWSRGQS